MFPFFRSHPGGRLASFTNNRSLRKLRVKAIAWAKFFRVSLLIIIHPKRTAAEVASKAWPLGVRPKTFFALGFAVYTTVSYIDPHVTPTVTWLDVLLDLPSDKQARFWEIFHINSDELILHADEEMRLGNRSPLSGKIRNQVGSVELEQIIIYLANRDKPLATAFAESAKYAQLLRKMVAGIKAIYLSLLIVLSLVSFHFLASPIGVERSITINLGLFFAGYYLLIYSLFVLLRYEWGSPNRTYSFMFLEACLAVGGLLQFALFINHVHRLRTIRLGLSIAGSAAVMVIGQWAMGSITATLIELPVVDNLLHRVAALS
jgi:hypothetical protein